MSYVVEYKYPGYNFLYYMTKHKLSPYRVKLRQNHKNGKEVRTEDLWKLDELGAMNPGLKKYDNFIDLLESFFQHLRDEGYLNDDAKRALTATRFETGSGDFEASVEARTVEAELTYGRYDRVADHTDKDAFDDVNDESPYENRRESERDRNTVAETRLHFLGHVPTNTTRSAFFVLHSYGRNSVKSRLENALNQFIRKDYDISSPSFAVGVDRRKDTFKMEMNTVAGPDLIDKLKKSKIVGFEVQKRDTNVPEYMSESTALGNDSEGNLKIKYTSDSVLSDLQTKRQSLGERIRNEDYPLGELVDNNPSRANAIVETSDGDNRRVNISRDEIRMEEIINPTDLKYDSDGRVQISEVGKEARRHLNKKLQEVGATTLDKDSLLS